MDNLAKPSYFDTDFYKTLIETLQDGVFVIKDGRFILVNQAFADMVGTTREALLGTLFMQQIVPEYQHLVAERYQSRTQGKKPPNEYQIEIFHSRGHRMIVQLKVETFSDKNDKVYIVCSIRDVTLNTQLMKRLQDSEREFKQIIENLPGFYYRTDAAGNLIMASPYALKMLGYIADEAIGKPMTDFYAIPEERAQALESILASQGAPVEVETLICKSDGSTVWVSTCAYARYDHAGEFLGVEGVSLNITKQKNREYELQEKALRDSLTGLVNRFGLLEHFEKALIKAKRKQFQLSIVFIDLDDFKLINDRFGHLNGDQYLIEFANRLRTGFRGSDMVARIGGDEFVVLLDNSARDERTSELLLRLEQTMDQPLILDDETVYFKYSYGVATYPKDGCSTAELLKFADKQMYFYKKQNERVVF
ncbi:sensor domain-containing diguanylate cyclase [Aliikangiella maris]|uniref:Diguanylate cyclase n=2 Tax=Aliikangiella maris TaxID=3162458 RepID=A0ABV3MS82_9GAMM